MSLPEELDNDIEAQLSIPLRSQSIFEVSAACLTWQATSCSRILQVWGACLSGCKLLGRTGHSSPLDVSCQEGRHFAARKRSRLRPAGSPSQQAVLWADPKGIRHSVAVTTCCRAGP